MDEEWRDIPGYEGLYQASNTGYIRSLDRTVKCGESGKRKLKGKKLTPIKLKSGYLSVAPSKNGKSQGIHVHLLIIKAFSEGNHDNMVCIHKDGNLLNNTINNLCWVPHTEMNQGEKAGTHKLTKIQVKNIRKRYSEGGISLYRLGRMYGVNQSTIRDAIKYISWNHI